MKIGAIATAFFLCLFSATLVAPDYADAARMGGGRSFGSKPYMSTPAKPPVTRQQNPGSFRQDAQAGAARPGGMFGGMGGILGGVLAGTLLGSLLSGGGFSGGGLMDILLIGLLLFLAYKLFVKSRIRHAPAPVGASLGSGSVPDFNRQGLSRPDTNSTGWDAFRSATGGMPAAARPDADIPANFNVEEFLQGAKMAYARMQKSWDKRDLDDIAQFADSGVMKELREQAQADPSPSSTDIILLNAELVGVENEGSTQAAQVYFDALLRENPNQAQPTPAREIWHFTRQGDNGTWRLDGIQQVE